MLSTKREEYIVNYGQAFALLSEVVEKYPKAMWHFKPGSNQWSIHEVIVHITDSEANSYIRCRCFIAEPGKSIMAYDQDAWSEKLKYHDQSTDAAIKLFALLRASTYDLIKNLPEIIWASTVFHPEHGTITMDDWLVMYANHIPVHIKQMERIFEAWKKTETP